jgi:hypothetical protein
MELQGRVVRLLPLKEGVAQSTGNPYRTQDFIFGYYENQSDIYERNILLNVRNENIEKYKLAENDKIKVRISLGCREYQQGSGKYFNDIRTGDITIIQKANVEGTQQSAQPANDSQVNINPQPQQNAATGGENHGCESDDLPF